MILHHVQTVPKHIPTMQNGASAMRFLSRWQKDTEIYKACSTLKHTTLGTYWKCPIFKNNGKRKTAFQEERIPSSTQVCSGVGQSGIQNWCQSVFIQTFRACAGAATTAPLNISCLSNFHAPANDSKISIPFTNQNTMSLPSHVEALPPDMLASFFCLINQ